MRSIFSLATIVSSCVVTFIGSQVDAGVWSEEQTGQRGSPVRFCMKGICEDTRFILKGSTRVSAFFGLANGYDEYQSFEESPVIYTNKVSLNGELLSAEDYATVRLERGYDEKTVVRIGKDGRYVSVEGWISQKMVSAFERVTSSNPNLLGVSLKSKGGDAEAALRIAGIIESRNLSTFVADGSYCHASCSTMFLSGHDRLAKGLFEVAPLIAAVVDQNSIRQQQLEVLSKAGNDQSVLDLVSSLKWNQTYLSPTRSEFDRDLPGDALSN